MTLSENDINLIEKHLEEILTKEEKVIFAQKRAKSSLFDEEIELQKTMITSIRLDERKELRTALKKEVKKIDLPAHAKKSGLQYYSIAATISLLIIVGYLFLPSNDSLFEAYYSPFPENPITRSESGNTSNYGLAMHQYSIGDYQKALDTFLKMSDSSIQDEIALYKGNCFLNLDKPNEAIVSFQTAINSDNNQIVVHAQWFLALAFIMNDDKHKARELLHEIHQGESPYSDKASVLLKKLQWTFY